MTHLGISEVSGRLGIWVDTLRYYERAAILPAAARDGAGRRRYTDDDLHLLGVLLRLRRTDMPVREAARSTELRSDPDGVAARIELPLAHRQRVPGAGARARGRDGRPRHHDRLPETPGR